MPIVQSVDNVRSAPTVKGRCRDRTKRNNTAVNKFRLRCLQALALGGRSEIFLVWLPSCVIVRDPNVGMIVGPDRWNASHAMISMGFTPGDSKPPVNPFSPCLVVETRLT